MKKITIVGAGVSGLTAGIYAARSGFDVSIYEQHSISGGTCTSWKRKGYTFEGAVHWLTDSGTSAPLYKLWNETGALNKYVEMFRANPFVVYEYCGQKISLYRNLDKIKEELLRVSKEDKKEINKLCKDIKAYQAMQMPIMYIKGVKVKKKIKMKLSALMKMMPAIFKYKKLVNMSMQEYTKRFRHSGIKNLLTNIIIPSGFNALSAISSIAIFINNGGYPEGGSLAMTKRMEDKFRSLGGKIFFNSKVEKVIVKENKAKGIILNGQEIFSDAVIVTQDILKGAHDLFENPLKESWIENLNSDSQLCTFISLGIKADLSELPHCFAFDLKTSVEVAGIRYGEIGFYNYSKHLEYAPKGSTALTVCFLGDSYAFWNNAKKSGTYESEKKAVADIVAGILEEKFPKIKGNIDVIDVTTPLTYERYTGSYKGSWMTSMPKGTKMNMKVGKSESVNNLYFAGFRLISPGGLPVALMTGFRAAQMVCKDFNYTFEGR